MSNPEEGQVSFKAGDKEYTLEITNRTERSIQQRLKRPMGKVISSLVEGDFEVLHVLFHEGLKKHHKDIKEDEALDLVRPKQLRDLVGKLLQVTYPSDDPPQPSPETDATGSAN